MLAKVFKLSLEPGSWTIDACIVFHFNSSIVEQKILFWQLGVS